MTLEELLNRLVTARTSFDRHVAAIPDEAFDTVIPGFTHTPKDIVAHVAAYEQLIVERLVAARHGSTTAFDRDRVGWEEFNAATWGQSAARKPKDVLEHSAEVFQELVRQVSKLSDAELAATVGTTASLDPTWLQGRSPGEMIAMDAYEHYPMHHEALDAAAGS